jgi:hypothetical protein
MPIRRRLEVVERVRRERYRVDTDVYHRDNLGPDLLFSPVARIANRGEWTQSPTTDDGDRIHHGRILQSY